jgi:type IV pilus assembly protein PilC
MATEAVQTTYLSQGADKSGNKTKGEIQGSNQAPVKAQLRNQAPVKAQLRKQGVAPTKVKRKSKDLFGPRRQKIKPGDIAVFTRQLATIMKLGITLVQSFEIVGETIENSSMRELVGQIRDDVTAGNTFAGCIRKHPRYFQP